MTQSFKRLAHTSFGCPWFWAGLFIALIPMFAVLFGRQPGDFFQPSITREQSVLTGDSQDVIDGLESRVRAAAEASVGGTDLQLANGAHIPIDQITVSSLRPEDDYTEITFRYVALGGTEGGLEQQGGAFTARISYQPDATVQTEDLTWFVYVPADRTGPTSGLPIQVELSDILLADPAVPWNSVPGVPILTLDPAIQDSLVEFRSAVGGDPYFASSSFQRFSYLSVVTITTLGFGDIVPVTARARFLVGLEAVAGLVLMGLFINAVARRAVAHDPVVASAAEHERAALDKGSTGADSGGRTDLLDLKDSLGERDTDIETSAGRPDDPPPPRSTE